MANRITVPMPDEIEPAEPLYRVAEFDMRKLREELSAQEAAHAAWEEHIARGSRILNYWKDQQNETGKSNSRIQRQEVRGNRTVLRRLRSVGNARARTRIV